MGWLQGKRDVTLSDVMLCHMLIVMMYIRCIFRISLEVKLCASWYSNSEFFRVIWIYELFISCSGMEHVSSSLFTSALRPQVLTYLTCVVGVDLRCWPFGNPSTDQHHPILMLTTLTWRLHFVFSSYHKPPYWQVTHHCFVGVRNGTAFRFWKMAAGTLRGWCMCEVAKEFFQITYDTLDIVIINSIFNNTDDWRSETHVHPEPPPHINPEPPNLKWHEKGVVARRRKGGGPATCHCSLHFCQGWERTLYPSCRDGNPFVQLGACSMILQWPIISHSQGRPLKDAAWYSNPCVTLLYIICPWKGFPLRKPLGM